MPENLPAHGPSALPRLFSGLRIVDGQAKHHAFVDQMQKFFPGALGFLWDTAIAKHIERGHLRVVVDDSETPFGYCLAQPTYSGRDELGVVYQLAVVPVRQRRFVGAALIGDFFSRAPYGMKLACCWCAQDLPANYFWESLGFIPLAFRTGSRGNRRIHIFWQRRVRKGDTRTPFWFPAKTGNGSIAEDRIVLPVPPGTHWRDAKPVLLPDAPIYPGVKLLPNGLPDPAQSRRRSHLEPKSLESWADRSKRVKQMLISSRGPKLLDLTQQEAPKLKAPPKPRAKADPAMIAKARDFRDRYLDAYNDGLLLEQGKYDPARLIEAEPIQIIDAPRQISHDTR